MRESHVVLAITGASGCIYGLRLGEELLRAGVRLSFLISRPGLSVVKEECGLAWEGDAASVAACLSEYFKPAEGRLFHYGEDDFFSPLASGSSVPDAMIVAPCSMGSLARIASGLSGNLLERTADVMIKEARPLVLVPREAPLSAIHLENMLKLSRLGVRIVPAMPAFYGKPRSVDDLVNFVVGKVMDTLGMDHTLYKRWGEDA